MKTIKKITNWLCNWAMKLPNWELVTVMVVFIVIVSVMILSGVLFIAEGITTDCYGAYYCTFGVALFVLSFPWVYFTICIQEVCSYRVALIRKEHNQKRKNKSKEEVHERKARK